MDKTEKEILDFATRLHTESSITGIIRVVRDYFRQMDKVNQLKAENEELKEINSKLLEHRKHSATCQECYKDGLEDGLSQNKTLSKYKQALTKIKEVCLEAPAIDTEFSLRVLEKISEVIDD